MCQYRVLTAGRPLLPHQKRLTPSPCVPPPLQTPRSARPPALSRAPPARPSFTSGARGGAQIFLTSGDNVASFSECVVVSSRPLCCRRRRSGAGWLQVTASPPPARPSRFARCTTLQRARHRAQPGAAVACTPPRAQHRRRRRRSACVATRAVCVGTGDGPPSREVRRRVSSAVVTFST